MSSNAQLLDTPKRTSLQSQSIQIRAALKEYERSFAADNDGRKPSKDDIKADADVAAKYKEYNKIRDVLSGKLDYAAIAAPIRSSPKRRKHERSDSGVSWMPRKQSQEATPRRVRHPSELEAYDLLRSASPKPILLHAIGPTPQRDGRVLGLFDMLSNSGHSSKTGSSTRKRKFDALVETSPQKRTLAAVAQTPSQRKSLRGDLLEHLTGSPADTPETGRRKLSKTPISEGRKFMLSQFFATPSATRFSDTDVSLAIGATPLRDQVLGLSPKDNTLPSQQRPDATPAYLRRSTSFKDRLLSASQPSTRRLTDLMSPPSRRVGPPTLRHFRSMPQLFSDIRNNFSDIEEDQYEDDHEDELDALRELEGSEVNVLIADSQQKSLLQPFTEVGKGENDVQAGLRPYKKKGQKRTTRKSTMRPTRGKSAHAPKFVAAGHEPSDDEDVTRINESQLVSQNNARHVGTNRDCEEDFDDSNVDGSDFEDESSKRNTKSVTKKIMKETKAKKTATINPNAVSHMNFRTLKIKNKNSKAKGRGRFGRSRR